MTIKSTDKDNIRYIALLNVVLLISCFTREQTIYFLPLYIIFFIFSNLKNKSIAIISIIITVTSTSIFISNINKTNYGIDSKYRDFHLVVKLMQYGYLNQEVKDKYYNNLSSQSKALISDIEHEYKKNILPSKREKFQSKNFNLPFYYLIHPDNQNIYLKNNITPYKGNLELVKQKIKNKLFNGKKVISISDLSKRRDLINIDASIFPSLDNRNLFSYTTSILIDYYLIEENLCLENFKNNEAYVSSQCVLNILKGIDDTYLKNKSNNWMYTKAAFNIALSFDPNSKKYNQNQNIQSLKEIFLKYPYLYITQSLLTATSMTGAVYYNAISNKIINSTPIFRWILSKSQKYYRVIINLWYLFSLLNIFILYKYYKKSTIRRNNLLVSAIPLYYLIFISFATYAEFGRIILTAAPFIIFNFFQVILFISKNLGEASNHEVVKN